MEQKIMIAKDINLVEDGIFVNGIKITSSKDWNKVVEESIPKQVIRDKINKLKDEFDFFAGREHAEWQDGEFDGEVCDDLALQIKILKELLGE